MRLGILWIATVTAALLPAAFASAQQAQSGQAGLASAIARTDTVLDSATGAPADPFSPDQPAVAPEWEDQHVNNGGTHFSVDFAYVNRYFYRGVDHDSVATHGNSLNLLFDGRLEFDTGNYPHPFFELFTNIYDADPVSRFQEIRPIAGLDWNLRPFDVEFEHINYIYPERETFNVPEVDLKVTLDDSLLLNTEQPILSPYVQGAFVYQKNDGWYMEIGVQHAFSFPDLGVTITPESNVGWISGLKQQFVFVNPPHCTGWQHVEVGCTITYSLNVLLDLSKRYGEFDIKGYGFYDDKLSSLIEANNGLWGGAGLSFKY
jgi:hypothetical protein